MTVKIGRPAIVILGALTLAVVLGNVYEAGHRIAFGKASYSREAAFSIPGTSNELSLDRRATHVFLAEYERTLVLRDEGKEIFRFVAAEDTGGYSRMNVYQIDRFRFYLAGDHSSDRYIVNTLSPAISRELSGQKPAGAQFVGVFDRDERGWRFIPASEREEKPAAFAEVKRTASY